MKLSIKCKLDNIVTNLDGTTTFSFRQDKVSNASRLKYINEVTKCQETAKQGLKIDIDKYIEKRSLDANSYFHLLINKLAEYHGLGNDEMKIKMVLEYGTIAEMSNGQKFAIQIPKGEDITSFYPYAKWYGEIVDNGIIKDKYILYKQTHTLNTKEMFRLIDGVIYECKEVGIKTITPNQEREMMSLYEIK